MVTFADWKREKESLARLKAEMDRLGRDITERRVREEAELAARLAGARELCAELFPERLELFDLVYASRCRRLWEQFGPGRDRGAESGRASL